MNCEYVREYYRVPACINRRVIAYGKPGMIVKDRGHYIGINLDEDKPGVVNNYHPTDGIEYLGMGEPRKITRAQKRYQEYLDSAYFAAGDSFATLSTGRNLGAMVASKMN